MLDFAEKWPASPDWSTAALNVGGATVRTLDSLSQLLVSGDLVAWSLASGVAGKGVGAADIVSGDRYAVRVARDRILVVANEPLAIEAGWHADGFAVTTMDAGLHVFEISGSGTPGILARATTLDPDGNSPSASVLFAGVAAILYRHENCQRIRVHVDRGLAPYLWEWLKGAS